MKSHRCTYSPAAAGLIALMLSLGAVAQETAPAPPPGPPPGPLAGDAGADVMFTGGKFAFVGMAELNNKVVTGAPYSAEASTETTQTLSDGNQIVRNETSQVYRDSQGRTRREHTLLMLGPWSGSGAPHHMISINDPVAGFHYMLNPEQKTAMKMPARLPDQQKGAKLRNRMSEMREKEAALGETVSESLGSQAIEGVSAQGTRVTETIPAGKIGNARPITIVSERWYSPQLQIYILTKRSDPRFGDTVYKLTNINTTEPSPDLFQVPADYSVKEGGHGMRAFRYEAIPK
jgi:hypothetical protein